MYETIHSEEPWVIHSCVKYNKLPPLTLSSKFSLFASHSSCLQLHLADSWTRNLPPLIWFYGRRDFFSNLLMRRRQHILGLVGSSGRRSLFVYSLKFVSSVDLVGCGDFKRLSLAIIHKRTWPKHFSSVLFLWRIFAIWRQQFSKTNYVEYSFFFKIELPIIEKKNCLKSPCF
jgi:hypothetical protein